jgi:hypothetical protein
MKQNTKVIINIDRDSDAIAIEKTEAVLDKMGQNAATFPFPTVPLSTMYDDKEDLIKKVALAQYGGIKNTLAKNEARRKVNNNYRANGNYTNSVIKGDKKKALLSGYILKKQRSKSKLPSFELKNLKDPGNILVICRSNPRGLLIKLLQYSYDPEIENSWEFGGLTRKVKKIIRNLVQGQRVWVRVAVVVDEEIIEYGDPISIIVT